MSQILVIGGWGFSSEVLDEFLRQLRAQIRWPIAFRSPLDGLPDVQEIPEHVVGWSMGGFLAQEIVQKYPDRVNRLTLINCALRFCQPELGGVRAAQLRAMRLALKRDRDAVLQQFATDVFAPDTPPEHLAFEPDPDRLVEGLVRLGEFDFRDVPPPRPSVQTLIVHGRRDRLIPYQASGPLGEHCRAKNVKIFTEQGHALPIQVPESLAGAVVDFSLGQIQIP